LSYLVNRKPKTFSSKKKSIASERNTYPWPKDVVHVSWAVFLCPSSYLFLPSSLPSSYAEAAVDLSRRVVGESSSSVGTGSRLDGDRGGRVQTLKRHANVTVYGSMGQDKLCHCVVIQNIVIQNGQVFVILGA
jgi:hypothetical protein